MKNLSFIPACLISILTVPPSFAADEDENYYAFNEHEVKEFTEIDKNADGLVSIQEARDGLPGDIVVFDTNEDGLLNRDEVRTAMPEVSFQQGIGNQPIDEYAYREMMEVFGSVVEQTHGRVRDGRPVDTDMDGEAEGRTHGIEPLPGGIIE